MKYRRAFVPGGSYFFTVVTDKRRPLFQSADTVAVLRDSFRAIRLSHPFEINAMVVLPDHLHCIWTLPQGDEDFSMRWRLIKIKFTKHCDKSLCGLPNRARLRKSQQAVWQHRFWEHLLRDEADYQQHIEYIHYNPVKHGYVSRPLDWPWSSFRWFVSDNIYPQDWGCGEVCFADDVGKE